MSLHIKDAIEKAEQMAKSSKEVHFIHIVGSGFGIMSQTEKDTHPMMKPVYDTERQLYANRKVKLENGLVVGFEN